MRNDFNIKPHDSEGYIFISGTPRCGTQYIAQVFQEADIDVQHEAFGEAGISAFQIVPHVSQIKRGLLIHQLRDPIKTLGSMLTISKSWHYIHFYTGLHPDHEGLLIAVMKLWLRLNLEIEKHHKFRYKVEDIDKEWPILCDILGIPAQPLPAVPKNSHTRVDKYVPLSWAELEFRDPELTKHIKETALRYGYEVND